MNKSPLHLINELLPKNFGKFLLMVIVEATVLYSIYNHKSCFDINFHPINAILLGERYTINKKCLPSELDIAS